MTGKITAPKADTWDICQCGKAIRFKNQAIGWIHPVHGEVHDHAPQPQTQPAFEKKVGMNATVAFDTIDTFTAA